MDFVVAVVAGTAVVAVAMDIADNLTSFVVAVVDIDYFVGIAVVVAVALAVDTAVVAVFVIAVSLVVAVVVRRLQMDFVVALAVVVVDTVVVARFRLL